MAAQPKAFLCLLEGGAELYAAAQAQMQRAGFAVAAVKWAEMDSMPNGWMGLAEAIAAQKVDALVVLGKTEDFTPERIACFSLLALAFPAPFATAFVATKKDGFPALPAPLAHVQVLAPSDALGAKMMAARVKKYAAPELPFHITPYLSSATGIWLEVAPSAGEEQPSFMIGLLGADAAAFGIGSWGSIPERCTLSFPMRGIKGEIRGVPFDACAAKDALGKDCACYLKVSGTPLGILMGQYPGEGDDAEMYILPLGPVPQ